jgi:ABC-type antimicrobial peptide transport system permease subunit
MAPHRLLATLVAGLAAVAVLLAVLGLQVLIANSVVERTREIGIRLALGSSARRAVETVMVPGLALSTAGIGIGVGLALLASRLLRSLVWGVSATDPATYAGAAVAILAVTTAATLAPALRILRIDPARTLRQE